MRPTLRLFAVVLIEAAVVVSIDEAGVDEGGHHNQHIDGGDYDDKGGDDGDDVRNQNYGRSNSSDTEYEVLHRNSMIRYNCSRTRMVAVQRS